MRYLIVLLAPLMLSGCFFFMIPIRSSQPDAEARWNSCVDELARVGARITNPDGKIGTVRGLYGRSDRCPTVMQPVLAEVGFERVWEQK